MTQIPFPTNGSVGRLGIGLDRDFRNTGRLSIDLALTGLEGEAYAHLERTPSATDLDVWLAWCQLGARVQSTHEEYVVARQLRWAVWHAIQAVLTQTLVPMEGRAVIDTIAAKAPLIPQLMTESWLEPTTSQALSVVARDAIELLRDPFLASRLRTCASPDCGVPFVDVSRPGRRRWCEDARCGDRNRQRRHREKVKQTG